MADEFSTPISSLGMETTRSQDKSTVQPQSYEEILRHQNEPNEPVQKKVRFRDPQLKSMMNVIWIHRDRRTNI